jgi:hypothetical protein
MGQFCSKKFEFSTISKAKFDGKNPATCSSSGNFYLVNSASGNCEYAFNGGVVSKINTDKAYGFSLKYTSKENCKEDTKKKVTVDVTAMCDRT